MQDPTHPLSSPETAAEPKTVLPRESALQALLGLVVLWITLVLLFKAHSMSDAHLVVGPRSVAPLSADQDALPQINTRDTLALPISMSWWGISPRQALDLIAEHVGFDLRIDGVEDRLDHRNRKIHLQNLTLGRALHRLLDSPDLGYGLRNGRHLVVFAQRMRIQDDGALPRTLQWSADLPLSLQPLIVSPAESTDLRLSICLRDPVDPAAGKGTRVAFGLLDGPFWLAMAHVDLNAQGQGEVRLSNTDYVVGLKLARQDPTRPNAPPRYHLELNFAIADGNDADIDAAIAADATSTTLNNTDRIRPPMD